MQNCNECEFKGNCFPNKDDEDVKIIASTDHGEINTIKVPQNKFYKVSYDQFKKDCIKYLLPHFEDLLTEEFMKDAYDNIILPIRSTKGSAGYDFFNPFDYLPIYHKTPVVIPTGIKMELCPGFYLGLFPRSSMGYKYGMRLENTVGIIDADYYDNPDNEGHIMAKISVNKNEKLFKPDLELYAGDKFMQGIIMGYGITVDDTPLSELREGGIGSTGK